MILHVLGGGPAQLNLIKRIKERGHLVAVSDMDPDAPGLKLAHFPSLASSFDPEAVYEAAKAAGSQRLLTCGTDQPVLTAAIVSERLGIPYFLNTRQARQVTNKKDMKALFQDHDIPCQKSCLLKAGFQDTELEGLQFPLVIKPVDSQGQRGVLRVESPEEIRSRISEVLSYSREKEILVEEFYESDEVTISGWVYKGTLHLFSITDRVTIENNPYMGVCISHRYPSLFHKQWDELESLSQRICRAIGLMDGPVYFQVLGGKKGFRINEIACRLGGAYEDEFLPQLCGADPLELLIDQSCKSQYNWENPWKMSDLRKGRFFSLQMFFCRPGVIECQSGVFPNGGFLLPEGTRIRERQNSTQRAGYFFLSGDSPEALNQEIDEVYSQLKILDTDKKQLIESNQRMYFPHEK